MSFILMYPSGREHWLDDMARGAATATTGYTMGDIAHHLANIARFNGATSIPYSVAEHSLLVRTLLAGRGASAAVQLAGLMHDAHEAFIGDLATPVKSLINLGSSTLVGAWRGLESRQAHAVRAWAGLGTVFGVPGQGQAIYLADLGALALERRHLTAWRRGVNTGWDVLRDDDGPDSIDARLDAELTGDGASVPLASAVRKHFARAEYEAGALSAVVRITLIANRFAEVAELLRRAAVQQVRVTVDQSPADIREAIARDALERTSGATTITAADGGDQA